MWQGWVKILGFGARAVTGFFVFLTEKEKKEKKTEKHFKRLSQSPEAHWKQMACQQVPGALDLGSLLERNYSKCWQLG